MSPQTTPVTLEAVTRKIQRIEEAQAIQNLISLETYLFEAREHEKRFALFAQKTPGLTVELSGRGVFEGVESARRTIVDTEKMFDESHGRAMRTTYADVQFPCDAAGRLDTQLTGTPMIEVAGDLETARAMWIMLSAWTTTMEGTWGAPEARWAWNKAAADFVKEDGEWRFWHYVRNPIFMTEYTQSWVDRSLKAPRMPQQMHFDMHGAQPDRLPSKQYSPYSITRAPSLFPPPPEPYETFADVEPYSY
jgi:hypothetical protein